MRTATYARLNSGEWGARVTGAEKPDLKSQVQVQLKDGSSKIEIIHAVRWSGTGPEGTPVHLCSIESEQNKPKPLSEDRSVKVSRSAKSNSASVPNFCPNCGHNLKHSENGSSKPLDDDIPF